MTPDGASYAGEFESFVAAAPMAATDMVVHPDGNLYFAVGGRRTASSLYRVRYVGNESTAPATAVVDATATAARELRRKLESYHSPQHAEAIPLAIANLGNEDRAIRFAARIALEHQPVADWQSQALAVKGPLATANAAYALARVGAADTQPALLEKLTAFDFSSLSADVALEILRAQHLVWMRLAEPTAAQREAALAQFDSAFPSSDGRLGRELASSLIRLNAPNIIPRAIEQMATSAAQDDQIHFAFALRDVKEGWTDETLKSYMQWFRDVQTARGGASFGGFLTNIRSAVLDNLNEHQLAALGSLVKEMPAQRDPLEDLTPRDVVEQWTVATLEEKLAQLSVKPDYDQGRRLTATAQCFKCHRFAGRGGITGPDLTQAGGRFSATEMLVAIIDPNKSVSDQYQATQFLTEDRVITGRIANLSGDTYKIVEDMLDPGKFTDVKVSEILEQRESPTSMMPAGLLNTFTPEEVAQILAYLRSGGNPKHELYSK